MTPDPREQSAEPAAVHRRDQSFGITVQYALQPRPGNAKPASGLALVAVDPLQGRQYGRSDDGSQRRWKGELTTGVTNRFGQEEIGRVDGAGRRENQGPLDRVLELADVA